jgi:hypothetical protein
VHDFITLTGVTLAGVSTIDLAPTTLLVLVLICHCIAPFFGSLTVSKNVNSYKPYGILETRDLSSDLWRKLTRQLA